MTAVRRQAKLAGTVIGARVLVGGLLALGVGGCGAAARAPAPRPAAHVRTARACARPAHLSVGMVIDGWRMGAVSFSSPEDGVGVTAAEVWCDVSLGKSGVEPTLVPQTVLVAVTHDGGARWTTVGSPPPGATLRRATGGAGEQLVAASPDRLWLQTAAGRVLATANGGASWARLPAPAGAVGITLHRGQLWVPACRWLRGRVTGCRPALARLDVATGRWTRVALPERRAAGEPSLAAVGGSVVLYTAQDTAPPAPLLVRGAGGGHWRSAALPRWNGHPCPVPAGFAAADARTWWFLCIGIAAAGSSTKALFETTDGGRRWHVVSQADRLGAPERPGQIPVSEPGELAPASRRRLWLALANGLAVSADGGAAWQTVPIREVNPEGHPTLLDVLNRRVAWLLAPGAGLWRTTDGVHWRALGPLHAG